MDALQSRRISVAADSSTNSSPSPSQSSHGRADDTCRRMSASGAENCSQGSSSCVLPNTTQLLHLRPHLLAGSSDAASCSSWSEELAHGQLQTGSIDCAVEVQVVVQQQTQVKTEASPQQQQRQPQLPQPPQQPPQQAAVRRQRGRIRCCGITLLVLGLLATGVLVPMAVTVGFRQDIAPEFRVLQPPAASHRLVFAFEAPGSLAATAAEVLPPDIARQVTSWAALPSSGIHVASFSDAQAMQQALAHLQKAAAAVEQQPAATRRRLQGGNSSSSAAGWALKYAVSDFQLLPHRTVTHVVDPMQLFDLARQQARTVLQLEEVHGASSAQQRSANEGDEEDVYLWGLQQRQYSGGQYLVQQQQQQQQQSRVAHAVPQTALHSQPLEQQHSRKRALAEAAELLPVLQRPQHATSTVVPLAPLGRPGQEVPSGLSSSGSRSGGGSAWGSVLRRVLLQSASSESSSGPALSFRQQLQPQQKQAQQQVQRGGSKVAWHLADGGLGVREAWNITSGLDRVVVAVIDSGVELASGGVGASLWTNAAEVAGDSIDNDGNGFVDDAMGWDFGGACGDIACSFCAPGPDPTDAVGWGTHAASAIAAQPEVASGTAGVAPGVRVMALKVADCRHGTQLWDVATQQGDLAKQPPADATADGSSSSGTAAAGQQQQQQLKSQQQGLGPMLLGSAAVQALDYALLNGAHIVVAGWAAGGLVGGSSSTEGQCFMGATAATAAQGGAGCMAAVQRQLFLDALRPLQQAGVLVVTMEGDDASSGSDGSAAAAGLSPPLPCSLSCDLDNVLCVSASTALLPLAGAERGLADVLSAAEFFAPLTNQHSSSYYNRLSSDAGGSSADPGQEDGPDGSAGSSSWGAALVSTKLDASLCSGRSSSGSQGAGWAQLSAPGTDILAGWAWGSHAVVSGGSAAASVTAGVAALAWSKLGQTMGADAAPGVLEGLGQRVKQELLQGSSTRTGAGSSNGSAVSRAGAAVSMRGGSGSSSIVGQPATAPAGELDLFGALQHSSAAPQDIVLQPAMLSTGTSSASRALRYSWHIQEDDSGPYDTNAMWYVGRKALKPASGAFPLTRWEFFGSTSLVELTGYLEVARPGPHELVALSEDRFVLWLQDVWLHMQPYDQDAAPWSSGGAWAARVNFTSPGLYKFRLIVYSPSKPFDLQWQPPGSSSLSSITSFVSLGQTQPLPQQLLHNMLLPLSGRADSSSERSSAGRHGAPQAAAQQQQQQAPTPPPAPLQPTEVAAASSNTPISLPATPASSQAGMPSSGSSSSGGVDDASSFATSTRSSSREYSAAAGGGASAPSSFMDDSSSMTATMEPAEAPSGFSGLEPQLAEDAAADGYAPSYSAGSGYQLQPAGSVAYTPAGVGDGGGWGGAPRGGGDFWGALSSLFGGGGGGSWFGRRLLLRSPRRALLGDGGWPALNIISDSSSSRSQNMQPSAASAAITAPPLPPPPPQHQQQRHVLSAAGWDEDAEDSSTALDATATRSIKQAAASPSSTWGRFSVALAFADRTQYRTLMPDLTTVTFTHTGVLPGTGLQVGGKGLALQENVLGFSAPKDNRGAYGMVQGWLDWRDLNPAAAAAAAQTADGSSGSSSDSDSLGLASGTISTEGAGLGVFVGGVSVEAAGVQFELTCESCSLQIDGMTVVGSLGQVETSSCVTPAAASSSSGLLQQQQQQRQQLLHLQMLFTTNDVRKTAFAVRLRPCTGLNSLAGSGGWAPLAAAAGSTRSPPAFAVSSAVVKQKHSSSKASSSTPVFTRGMLCAMQAQLPRGAAAAATGPDSQGSSSGGGAVELERLVFVPAEKLQQAITITVNGSSANSSSSSSRDLYYNSILASLLPPNATQAANASSSSTRHGHSLTVDAPVGSSGEDGDEGGPAQAKNATATPTVSSGNSSDSSRSYNITAVEEAEAAARLAELQRRAAQTAAAKAAALARGLTVADLAPEWASSMPSGTTYSFSCGCYWNGSWDGNVTVRVSAGGGGSSSASGDGSARLFLAGWPVAAKRGTVYGLSDLDVRGYSTVMQRQQLAAGSGSADPLTDVAHLWVTGGFGGSSSSFDADSLPLGASRSSRSSSSSSTGAQQLSATDIRVRRFARLQQSSALRSSGSTGSGSSAMLGLQPIGSIDGVSRRAISAKAGQHQLLVLQAEGLTADAQVVVLAQGDTSRPAAAAASTGSSSSSSSKGGAGSADSSSSTNSTNSSVSVVSSWLPGLWDAWVPAG